MMTQIKDYIPVGCDMLNEPALACPVCGNQYVHPVGVECRSPGTRNGLVRIDADGVAIDPNQPPVDRGTQITLRFVCEASHRFEYVLHFHKGATLVSRAMGSLPRDAEQWPATIWRD